MSCRSEDTGTARLCRAMDRLSFLQITKINEMRGSFSGHTARVLHTAICDFVLLGCSIYTCAFADMLGQ